MYSTWGELADCGEHISIVVLALVIVVIAASIVSGCSRGESSQTPAQSESLIATSATAQHYNDPFSYCKAVGTINQPDARYTGTNPPPEVIAGLIRVLGAGPSAAHGLYMRYRLALYGRRRVCVCSGRESALCVTGGYTARAYTRRE